jgi:hypothetical protein
MNNNFTAEKVIICAFSAIFGLFIGLNFAILCAVVSGINEVTDFTGAMVFLLPILFGTCGWILGGRIFGDNK